MLWKVVTPFHHQPLRNLKLRPRKLLQQPVRRRRHQRKQHQQKQRKAAVFFALEVPGQKFWHVTNNGSSIEINFGKVGTAGTTQIKDFGDNEECAKFVAKQIAAKQKKGY